MQMPPKVSIVVPCYNKEKYIDAMLESVHKQVWDNIELILVNDGSTDRTREIIAQWQPKLVQRGFDVVIIDQENAGLWAAVKTGLERASGEYICSVDCDDMIKSDFISIQASFLSENPEYDWTMTAMAYRDNKYSSVDELTAQIDSEKDWELPLVLEKYISGVISNSISIHMVRKNYMERCHVFETFSLAPQTTQEPCFMFPLILGGGKMKFLPKAVYVYNICASEHCKPTEFNAAWKYYKGVSSDNEMVLSNMNLAKKRVQYLSFLGRVLRLKVVCKSLEKTALKPNEKEQLLAEWTEIASVFFSINFVPPRCEEIDFNDFYITIFYTIVWSATATDKAPVNLDKCDNYRDIICYGALGKRAAGQLFAIRTSKLFPNKFWDISAKGDSFLYGYKVDKPNFDELCEYDLVLVFPRNGDIYFEVLEKSRKSGAKVIKSMDFRVLTESTKKLVSFGISEKVIEAKLFSQNDEIDLF